MVDYQAFMQSMFVSDTLGALITAGYDVNSMKKEELSKVLAEAHSILAPTYKYDEQLHSVLYDGFEQGGAFRDGILEAILQDPNSEFNQRYLQTVMTEAVQKTFGKGQEGLEMYLANAQAGFIEGIAQNDIQLIDDITSEEGRYSHRYSLQITSQEEANKLALLQANLMNKLQLAEQVYGVSLTQEYGHFIGDKDVA